MCLVQEQCVGFFASTIHSWMSHMIDVAFICTNSISSKSSLSQMASFVQWLVAIYIVFVDNAIVGCFLYFHNINLTPMTNIYLVLDCQSLHLPPSPFKTIFFPPWHNLRSKVTFKYLTIHFIGIQCCRPAFGSLYLSQIQYHHVYPTLHT